MKEIKELKQWVAWNCESQNPKRPYKANRRTPADTTDPKTWATYEEAKRHGDDVGLVITTGMIFVDLDHVLIKGKPVPWVRDLLDSLDPQYVEISPSGDGLHIIAEGEWDNSLRNKVKIEGDQALEVYGTERYSTITEKPFEDSPLLIKKCKVKKLKKFMGKATATKAVDVENVKTGKTVKQIKKQMKADGKWAKVKDADGNEWKSEDDYKFLHAIADAVGDPDPELIAAVFVSSNVARTKVVERIEYHVNRVVGSHIFHFGFEAYDDVPPLPVLKGDALVKAKLVGASRQGKVALEKAMTEIKETHGVAKATQKEIIAEAKSDEDGNKVIQDFFPKGRILWVPDMNLFAEVRKTGVLFHSKGGFNQTVMSASGYMTPGDVSKLLHSIPASAVVYKPDMEDMTETEHGDPAINTYRGVTFKKTGITKLPKLMNKVLDNLFRDQPEDKERFVNWIAYIVQKRKRTGVAWGFFGAQGSGKGLMVDVISRLLGHRNCSINVGDSDLQSAFNSYAYAKLFNHYNEIASDFHGQHGVAGKMKSIISDTTIRINMKGMQEIQADNYCNVILNSNSPRPIEIDLDDRRWNMVVTAMSLTSLGWFNGDKTYQAIIAEVDEFGAYLMQYEVDSLLACSINENSKAKDSVIAQTTSNSSQVAQLIKKGDSEGLIDAFALDPDTVGEKELIAAIEWACEHEKWSNQILLDLYKRMTGRDKSTSFEVSRLLIKPYLTTEKAVFKGQDKKSHRGIDFTPAS